MKILEFNSIEETFQDDVNDNQTMFVASAPILTNLNQGPVMGMMLFGRTIDSRELDQLSQIMNLDFTIKPISELNADKSGFQILDSLLLDEATVVVNQENPSEIFGYFLVSDVDSDPTFLLRVTLIG
jgi:sensor domain CHASE-containing protein